MTTTTKSRKLRTLPLEPLWKMACTRAGSGEGRESLTVRAFAEATNTNPRMVVRWRKEGALPWPSADRAAIGLGLHPILVWGDQWLRLDEDIDSLADDEWDDRAEEVAADLASSALDR